MEVDDTARRVLVRIDAGLCEADCDGACPCAVSVKQKYGGSRKIIEDGEDLGPQHDFDFEFGFVEK